LWLITRCSLRPKNQPMEVNRAGFAGGSEP
jgi:hypothetical protein